MRRSVHGPENQFLLPTAMQSNNPTLEARVGLHPTSWSSRYISGVCPGAHTSIQGGMKEISTEGALTKQQALAIYCLIRTKYPWEGYSKQRAEAEDIRSFEITQPPPAQALSASKLGTAFLIRVHIFPASVKSDDCVWQAAEYNTHAVKSACLGRPTQTALYCEAVAEDVLFEQLAEAMN